MSDGNLECALSGLAPRAEDFDAEDDDLPLVEWIEVRVRAKRVNPRFLSIQQVKAAQVDQTYAQAMAQVEQAGQKLTPRQGQDLRDSVSIQVDAYWAALEATTDKYVIEEEVVYIAPPSRDGDASGLTVARRDLLALLQLDDFGRDVEEAEADGEKPASEKPKGKKQRE